MHTIWKDYTLDELLLHLFLLLEWRDGYPEHEEGTRLANFHNYLIMFNTEYETLNVVRLMPDDSHHYIYFTPFRLSMLADAIISAIGFGTTFRLDYGEGLAEAVIEELDKLQDVRLVRTPEGKYISREKK